MLKIQKTDDKTEVIIMGKRWEELTQPQKSLAVMSFAAQAVVAMVQVGLLITALLDLRKRPAEQVKGRKLAWFFVVFINWIGPISYFIFGRKKASELVESSDAV